MVLSVADDSRVVLTVANDVDAKADERCAQANGSEDNEQLS